MTVCISQIANVLDTEISLYLPIMNDDIYQINEYIKENGVWKILSLKHGGILGWKWDLTIPKDRIATPEDFKNDHHGQYYPFTSRFGEDTPINEYPSGYILPFHFKHPVTGKETSEAAHNAAMPPFKRPKIMI